MFLAIIVPYMCWKWNTAKWSSLSCPRAASSNDIPVVRVIAELNFAELRGYELAYTQFPECCGVPQTFLFVPWPRDRSVFHLFISWPRLASKIFLNISFPMCRYGFFWNIKAQVHSLAKKRDCFFRGKFRKLNYLAAFPWRCCFVRGFFLLLWKWKTCFV